MVFFKKKKTILRRDRAESPRRDRPRFFLGPLPEGKGLLLLAETSKNGLSDNQYYRTLLRFNLVVFWDSPRLVKPVHSIGMVLAFSAMSVTKAKRGLPVKLQLD